MRNLFRNASRLRRTAVAWVVPMAVIGVAGARAQPPGSGRANDAVIPPTCQLSRAVPQFDILQHHERLISPRDLDPATDLLPNREHAVLVATDRPLQDSLLVWIPGTQHRPANNLNVLRIAAAAGYRTIGLAYPNREKTGETCGNQPPDCYEGFRAEKIYGADESALIEVNRENSIEYRLITLLKALHAQFPSEGWCGYLNNGELIWKRIVLIGFSQGAGMVGMVSRDHAVARAIFIGSGGGDTISDAAARTIELAPWAAQPRATPVERTWALLHQRDGFRRKRFVLQQYGLTQFGGFARADLEAPPYDCTHLLLTDHTPLGGDASFHNSLASDEHVPVDAAGIPLLAEDYHYLMVQ